MDNHQTFAAYAEYVLKQKKHTGVKRSTLARYRDDHDPNYFQPEEIARIWEALEGEPIKWRMMVHLFLVTGCRRGEVLGLKWGKVDWENKQIYINCNLLYRKELGMYPPPLIFIAM